MMIVKHIFASFTILHKIEQIKIKQISKRWRADFMISPPRIDWRRDHKIGENFYQLGIWYVLKER